MRIEDLAVEFLAAPLALLLGVGVLHVLVEMVDVDHFGAEVAPANIAAAVAEVAGYLRLRKRLVAVLASLNGFHRCEL